MRKIAILGIALFLLAGCEEYFYDSFSVDGYLAPGYRWFDEERTDSYEISGGKLRITASRGQDLWGGLPVKRGAPLMLRTAPVGDYNLECDVDARWSGTPQRINTQVGLFVFQDLQNWLFFGFTYHSGQAGSLPTGNGLIVTSVVGDNARIEHYEPLPVDHAKLMIQKSGVWWRFYYQTGGSWQEIGSSPGVYAPFGTHEVGMGVKSFQSGGTAQRGNFDNFRILIE